MDLSAYPHLAAVKAVKPTIGANLTPNIALEVNSILDKLIAHYREKEHWPDCNASNLSGDFHNMVAAAHNAGIIPFEEAQKLIRNLEPDTTYVGFVFGMWESVVSSESESTQLNTLKAALDDREPGKWLPNQPEVVTLFEKANELALADTDTVAGLRELFVLDNGLPLVLSL